MHGPPVGSSTLISSSSHNLIIFIINHTYSLITMVPPNRGSVYQTQGLLLCRRTTNAMHAMGVQLEIDRWISRYYNIKKASKTAKHRAIAVMTMAVEHRYPCSKVCVRARVSQHIRHQRIPAPEVPYSEGTPSDSMTGSYRKETRWLERHLGNELSFCPNQPKDLNRLAEDDGSINVLRY